MTDPQRHKLVAGGAVLVGACLVLYLALFGLHTFDPKSLIVLVGFFAAAAKLSTIKHKRNPML